MKKSGRALIFAFLYGTAAQAAEIEGLETPLLSAEDKRGEQGDRLRNKQSLLVKLACSPRVQRHGKSSIVARPNKNGLARNAFWESFDRHGFLCSQCFGFPGMEYVLKTNPHVMNMKRWKHGKYPLEAAIDNFVSSKVEGTAICTTNIIGLLAPYEVDSKRIAAALSRVMGTFCTEMPWVVKQLAQSPYAKLNEEPNLLVRAVEQCKKWKQRSTLRAFCCYFSEENSLEGAVKILLKYNASLSGIKADHSEYVKACSCGACGLIYKKIQSGSLEADPGKSIFEDDVLSDGE